MASAVRSAVRLAATLSLRLAVPCLAVLCLADGPARADEPRSAAPSARQAAEALPPGRFRTALLAELTILDARRPAAIAVDPFAVEPVTPAAAVDPAPAAVHAIAPPGWVDPFNEEPDVEAERRARQAAADRAEAQRREAARLAAERSAAERRERERLETERLAAERVAAERVAAERLEAERLKRERMETERIEAERLAAERREADRIAAERAEAARLAAERLAAEQAKAKQLAAEQAEAKRLSAEQAERERLEAERAEAERLEAERLAAERAAVRTPGFGPFCPVALRDEQRLVAAEADLTAAHAGDDWHFATAEAREAFVKNPARYLPVAGGRDVVLEQTEGFVVPGRPDRCVIYRDQLYLFVSARTRAAFAKQPRRYVSETE